MNRYNDTTQRPNAHQRADKGQNDAKTKVTVSDVIKSIITGLLLIGLLLLISSYQQAHPKNSLPLGAGMGQNNATTKHKAVKPNRHSLAIFVPKINPPTNRTYATGAKVRHNHAKSVPSYDGLIGVNTTPFTGNSPSRLYAVVESRHPMTFHSVTNLTNHKGVAING